MARVEKRRVQKEFQVAEIMTERDRKLALFAWDSYLMRPSLQVDRDGCCGRVVVECSRSDRLRRSRWVETSSSLSLPAQFTPLPSLPLFASLSSFA